MIKSVFQISIFLMMLPASSMAANFVDHQVSIPSHFSRSDLQGYISTPGSISGIRPAVLILIGSGEGSTDDSSRTFNPFQSLAHKLAEVGIVSLRFDKRGTGYNSEKGSFAAQTFNDYYDDARDALELLKSDPNVDSKHIVLLGTLLCIAGDSDWVIPSYHAHLNCQFANQHGIPGREVLVPNADHFFSVAKSREESLRHLMTKDFSQIHESSPFLDDIVDWIQANKVP